MHACVAVCTHTKERHHKVIRRYVKDRVNTTSLEKGLAEELVAQSLRSLRTEPIHDGFIAPHPAPQAMVRTLQLALQCSGVAVTTCVEARSKASRFHRGDVALYITDSNELLVGDIVFFAACQEWCESAFLSLWSPVGNMDADDTWLFHISDDIVRVPVGHLVSTAVAYIGERTAHVICPPITMCM